MLAKKNGLQRSAAHTAQNPLDSPLSTRHSEPMKTYYSARQFSRLIGKSNRTVTTWIEKGLIPGVKKMGRDYQIPSEELDRARTLDTYPDPNY